MASIKIAGGAAALVSTLKREDIRLLSKYDPKALTLYDGDKEVFKVSAGSESSTSQYGMCFAAATRDEAALAEITLMIPADVTDVKEFAVEKFGPAVLQLDAVEKQATEALASVKARLDQVRETVSVA